MQQKKIYLIIGIALGILGILLLAVYLRAEKEKMADELKRAFQDERKNLESVVVAVEDISRGETIDSHMVGTEIIPGRYLQPDAAKSIKEVAGLKTIIAVRKGEQITFGKLAILRRNDERTLSTTVPLGKRAITVKVDKISSVAGMIRAGDYVDVIALFPAPMRSVDGQQVTQTITLPLFQNVLVLAVGQEMYQKDEKEDGGILSVLNLNKQKEQPVNSNLASLVTLALPPQESSYLSFVSEQGKIRLILRSPADAKTMQVPVANWESLFQYVNSMYPSQAKSTEEKIKITPPRQVEIYRGLEKSYMEVVK